MDRPRLSRARRRLRVLHLFTSAFDPKWNWDADPVSRLIWPASSIVRHTDRRRFDLWIGTLRPPPAETADIPGLQLVALPIAGPHGYLGAIPRLARWLRRHGIDVVQTHLFDGTVVGLFAARLAGTRLAVATGHHSHEFAVMPPGPTAWLDAFCTSQLAHRMIVPSRFMADTVARTYHLAADRIAVVPHGLDDRRLASRDGDRARLRAELGLDGKVVIGAVGRLFWIKQYMHLVRAFAEAARHRPELALLIVGEGEQRAQLQELARALGVEDRLLLPGLRGDVTALYAAMDLFVHPALTESFGLVLVEAMAAGKPVISTAVGIAPDLIAPENGLLVDPQDPAALTRALAQLLAMPERWEALGRAGQARARTFTADRMVAAYERLYEGWWAAGRPA